MKFKLIQSIAIAAVVYAAAAFSSSIVSINAQPSERRIEVTAKRFGFTPGDITLKKGEPVVLVFTSADVPHGLRFRELGVEVKADKGQTTEARFTPDKTGDFVGHCSVFCGAGHGKMTLILHVVE